MADGFDIHIDAEQASDLRAAAEARGLDPAAYALQLLEKAIDSDDRWAISRARWAEYQRTGESMSVEEAFGEIRSRIKALRSKQA